MKFHIFSVQQLARAGQICFIYISSIHPGIFFPCNCVFGSLSDVSPTKNCPYHTANFIVENIDFILFNIQISFDSFSEVFSVRRQSLSTNSNSLFSWNLQTVPSLLLCLLVINGIPISSFNLFFCLLCRFVD